MPWRPLPDPDGEPPAPIAAPLDRVLRALGSPPAATLDDLFSSWSEVVGSAIGGVTTPLALDDGVLAVAVPDGGWASQIRWMERDLLVKFEDRFGPGVVTRIEARVRAR
jgi:predicted nucleic acid-binding Zn ribbon protein